MASDDSLSCGAAPARARQPGRAESESEHGDCHGHGSADTVTVVETRISFTVFYFDRGRMSLAGLPVPGGGQSRSPCHGD
jgi:hypothetical protein